MDLIASDFNELLAGIGQRCGWRRSYACPCVSVLSGSASTTCAFCSGKGRIWEDPVPTVLGKTGSDVLKKWAQFGQYDEGDTVMIVGSDSPAYAMGAFDRVLMLDQTEPFSMNLTQGVNARIPWPVVSVDKVLAIVQGALVNFGLPDISQDGVIEWPTGGPPPSAVYSLSGRRPVEFFAWTNQPFDRPHQLGEPLPRRIVMKRFDLFGR